MNKYLILLMLLCTNASIFSAYRSIPLKQNKLPSIENSKNRFTWIKFIHHKDTPENRCLLSLLVSTAKARGEIPKKHYFYLTSETTTLPSLNQKKA